ncbi:hypothetical protein FUAX_27890 [Fulvitalea axinellae]|uniref:Uncharacterized protein n=1 Tax=Fulvitalea axinellae TaxID=1182444 RepID=A0AAU9CXY5_9BACT|nr:hypothetical protein FUAX_27890 [Fulvitalea axinellae]
MKKIRLVLAIVGLLTQGVAVYLSWDISDIFFLILDNLQAFQIGTVISLFIYTGTIALFITNDRAQNRSLEEKDKEIEKLQADLAEMEEKLKEATAS